MKSYTDYEIQSELAQERDKRKHLFLETFLTCHSEMYRFEEITDIHYDRKRSFFQKSWEKEVDELGEFIEKHKGYADQHVEPAQVTAYKDFYEWAKSKEGHKGFQYLLKNRKYLNGLLTEYVLTGTYIGAGNIDFLNVVSKITGGIAYLDHDKGSVIFFADYLIYDNYKDKLDFKILYYGDLTVKVERINLLYYRDDDKDYITYEDCFYVHADNCNVPGNEDVGNYRYAKQTVQYTIDLVEFGIKVYCIYPKLVSEFCLYLKRLGAKTEGQIPKGKPIIHLNDISLPNNR